MDGMADQDFANLLDFESFDFLSGFDNGNGDGSGQQHHNVVHKNANGGVDMNMLAGAGQDQQRGGAQQNMFDIGMQQMGFGNAHQFGMPTPQQNGGQHVLQTHPHQMVPPTPNSVEMHGDVGRYLQQLDAQTRAIIEHEYKMRQQDSVSFRFL
jgi:hypothetical protein